MDIPVPIIKDIFKQLLSLKLCIMDALKISHCSQLRRVKPVWIQSDVKCTLFFEFI